MIITRTIEFAMGHRLQRHEGLCRHIHGHNYKVDVEVYANQLDAQGMVIDFHDLKVEMEAVFKKYDHAFVVEADDPFGDIPRLLGEARGYDQSIGMDRLIKIGMPPTAECLAKHWMGELDARIGNDDNMYVCSVTVHESSTTSARYFSHVSLLSNRREVR